MFIWCFCSATTKQSEGHAKKMEVTLADMAHWGAKKLGIGYAMYRSWRPVDIAQPLEHFLSLFNTSRDAIASKNCQKQNCPHAAAL